MTDYPPALLYHRIDSKLQACATRISPSTFREQIGRLAHSDYQTLTTEEMLNQSEEIPVKKPVLIVFDDGLECVFENAFPIMAEYGFKAIVFIPSGYIGRKNNWDYQFLGHGARHMNTGMLRELIASGWVIGSHTVSHTALNALPEKKIIQELTLSKKQLEDQLGVDIDWVSFPFGRYNKHIVNFAYEAGYRGAIVPVARKIDEPTEFLMIGAEAVYIWDSTGMVLNRLQARNDWSLDRQFRNIVNAVAGGTIILRKVFPAPR